MIDKLIIEEIKSNCNCPEKYQFVDFGGLLFGTFFIIDSLHREKDGWATIEFAIGSIMALIHSTRFFYKLGS